MTERSKAVHRIRDSGEYRVLVFGFRAMPLGVLVLAISIAGAALGSPRAPLVCVGVIAAFALVFLGVAAVWVGMLTLRSCGLMPRGGTGRHADLMKALRRDVVALRRRRR